MTFTYISYDQMIKDTYVLAGKLPKDIGCIVGLPRSGMLVASMLSTILHRPLGLYNLERQAIELIKAPGRGPKSSPGKTLIVDDSAYTGRAMRRVIKWAKKPYYTAVLYNSKNCKVNINFSVRNIAHPRAFAWNIFNGVYMKQAMLDIDGVLCHDPKPGTEASDSKYSAFILNAPPLNLPIKFSVNTLITNRLERWRSETELWLLKHGVSYHKLVMCPCKTAQERRRNHSYGVWKGGNLKNSDCTLLIESSKRQAEEAKRACMGKTVLCWETQQVL